MPRRKAAHERASLLTPVAKAFSTDIGIEVASLGVQVHGGMGFIEETGAAQHYRDARIAAIYEGTNGIQAIDLVTRKLPLVGRRRRQGLPRRAAPHGRRPCRPPTIRPSASTGRRLAEAVEALDRTTQWMLAQLEPTPEAALAGATPYLRLFGAAAGGCMLAEEALAVRRTEGSGEDATSRIALARFFAENISVETAGLERAVLEGADSVSDAALAGVARNVTAVIARSVSDEQSPPRMRRRLLRIRSQ